MIFTELRFFVFFAAVFVLYWALPRERWRKLFLLAASYAFYAAWDWRFLSLIVASTAVDYVAARRIARPGARDGAQPGARDGARDGASPWRSWAALALVANLLLIAFRGAFDPAAWRWTWLAVNLGLAGLPAVRTRRAWLLASLVTNLGILGIFKYFGFFAASAAALARAAGLELGPVTLGIVLPVGISFYTFQTLSYTIDVYRGQLEPRESLLDVAVFVAFFPQLVAGPIMRAREFLPQLERRRSFAQVDVKAALVLFLVGFFKKAVVSDTIAPLSDAYFADASSFDAVSSILGALLFAVQIFADFSGYSDMAIATAALLGYRLRRNFAHPYFATDVASFWRRWHISLSSWLRDYLYIPLGGGRGTRWATIRNLMVTMGLCGLWHGAGWNFVLFGLVHGVALSLHRTWSGMGWWRVGVDADAPPRWRTAVATVVHFYWWVGSLTLFRASDDLGAAWHSIAAMLTLRSPGELTLDPRWFLFVGLLAAIHWLTWRRPFPTWWRRVPDPLFALSYGPALALCLALHARVTEPFIYFAF